MATLRDFQFNCADALGGGRVGLPVALFRAVPFQPLMPEPVSLAPGLFDAARLAAMMKALASPVRLELLQSLRAPRMLGEIRLQPRRRDGSGPGRTMNRVSVRGHLDSLLAIGAVREVSVQRDGRLAKHFVLDYGQLFALTEELRQLARLQPEGGVLDGTMLGPPTGPPPLSERPHLVLANGLREGEAFPLRSTLRRQEWLVGRSPDADVCLEYDPYASMENSQVVLEGGRFSLVDLPSSRNGTTLNWEPLERGQPRPLSNGDVVGVGRSVLVFRT